MWAVTDEAPDRSSSPEEEEVSEGRRLASVPVLTEELVAAEGRRLAWALVLKEKLLAREAVAYLCS